MRLTGHLITVLLVATPLLAQAPVTTSTPHWPQWRGPHGTGAAPDARPPLTWSEQGENIEWKAPLPGKGHSSPIVWGDRVFVSTAVPKEAAESGMHEYTVMALSAEDGSLLWTRVARTQPPHESGHADGSWASASPVTDGERVYAYFGSAGLYCYDFSGKLVWETDFGDMQTRRGFGEGSSPALHGDWLVVNWDHEGDSFIVALDRKTGTERWRRDRDEITSWSSPLIVEVGDAAQVVTSATNRIRGYELTSGRLLWEGSGMTVNVIPTPVALDDLVFVTSGFRGNSLMAVRLSTASGDITGTEAVVWTHDEDTPYIPSPLLYDGTLYLIKRNGNILSAINATDGRVLFDKQRLEGIDGVHASPVGAGGHVYIAGTNGTTVVLRHGGGVHGSAYSLVATNHLDDSISASPAVSGDRLYLRGHQALYCLAAP